MAKSVRASVSKRNRANLRSTVFGPADNARTERLSAKLQEIAAQPKPNNQNKSNMELSKTRAGMWLLMEIPHVVYIQMGINMLTSYNRGTERKYRSQTLTNR